MMYYDELISAVAAMREYQKLLKQHQRPPKELLRLTAESEQAVDDMLASLSPVPEEQKEVQLR